MHWSQKQRLDQINEIRDYIEENQPVSLQKIQLKFIHIKPQTMKEYLESLKIQDKIKAGEFGEFKTK